MSLKPVVTKAPTAAMIISQERLRIMEILESPEGRKRPESARKLALNSNMSLEMCVDMLRGLPTESPFLDAMHSESIGISSATAGAIGAGSDPKQARLAEIKQAAHVYAQGRGYAVDMKA
jgi:hypothetical protein